MEGAEISNGDKQKFKAKYMVQKLRLQEDSVVIDTSGASHSHQISKKHSPSALTNKRTDDESHSRSRAAGGIFNKSNLGSVASKMEPEVHIEALPDRNQLFSAEAQKRSFASRVSKRPMVGAHISAKHQQLKTSHGTRNRRPMLSQSNQFH